MAEVGRGTWTEMVTGVGGVTLCDLLDPSGDLQQCVQGAGKEGLS